MLAELADEFGTGKIFRPYRDVRFSADKTPYKTNCAATIGSGYVSFSAEGLSVGGGLYMPDPKALARYREAVDKEKSGAELATIVAALHKAGYDTMAHDVLKTAPRGYPKDHPRIELLRHKGIAMTKELAGGRVARYPKGQGQSGGALCAPGCRSMSGSPVATSAERRTSPTTMPSPTGETRRRRRLALARVIVGREAAS